MNIQTIISDKLYFIENLVPDTVSDAIQAQDWLTFPLSLADGQETWARRTADNNAVSQNFHNYIRQSVVTINQQLGTKFIIPERSVWWVDFPGFEVVIHCDHPIMVKTALQMYWIAPSEEYGTVFYSDDQPTVDFVGCDPDQLELVHRFPSRANTGYLMRNEPDPVTGQRPRLWHGMLNPVPPGQFRLSSYTTLQES